MWADKRLCKSGLVKKKREAGRTSREKLPGNCFLHLSTPSKYDCPLRLQKLVIVIGTPYKDEGCVKQAKRLEDKKC